MKETSFIDQNKKKWHRYERLSDSDSADPDEVGDLYVEITNDLAYSQTHYPRRTVKVYLNNLAYKAVLKFNRDKKRNFNFGKLIARDIPLSLYDSRKSIYFAFAVFVVCFLIGAFSTEYDAEYLSHWTGDFYIWMTEENIAKGDPLAVYGDSGAFGMFSMIVTNNLRVGFITYILGAFLGLGSLWLLMTNSLMVGAFQWFFKVKGLLWVSFLGIWIHGAFEISSIILCAAAGFELWRGFFFPGTFSRREGLKRSGRASLRMFLTVCVFIVLAAIFESWVTRHYKGMPDWVKLTLILSEFTIMAFYFVVWPLIVGRRTDRKTLKQERTYHLHMPKIELRQVRTVPLIFSHAVLLYQHNLPRLAKRFIMLGIPLVVLLLVAFKTWWDVVPTFAAESAIFGWLTQNQSELILEAMGVEDFNWMLFVANGFFFALLTASAFRICVPDEDRKPSTWTQMVTRILLDSIQILPMVLLLLYVSLAWGIYAWLFLPLLLPFIIPSITGTLQMENILLGIQKGMRAGGASYGKALGLSYILSSLTWMAAMVFSVTDWTLFAAFPGVEENFLPLAFLGQFVGMLVPSGSTTYFEIMDVAVLVVNYLLIMLLIPLWTLAFRLLVLDRMEQDDPQATLKRIDQLGKRSKVFETSLDYE